MDTYTYSNLSDIEVVNMTIADFYFSQSEEQEHIVNFVLPMMKDYEV